MQVTAKVGNLHSKFGHARPLVSRIIRYVHNGQTDKRAKAMLIAPFPVVVGIIIHTLSSAKHKTRMKYISVVKCCDVSGLMI